MPLTLMYITNRPDIAQIADTCGVDRIFIDLELRGKQERQGHLDTVISYHAVEDVAAVKSVLRGAALLVRVNPLYEQSATEVGLALDGGADIIMLPYFKTADEVKGFVRLVDGRARTCLLCETPEAVLRIDEILAVGGVDEMHIGLNDLHLSYGMKFLFEPLADGTVDMICRKCGQKSLFYGFGGVAALGEGLLPAENILIEHYRLGSRMVILSRTFCDVGKTGDIDEIRGAFSDGVRKIRAFENEILGFGDREFNENRETVKNKVAQILFEKGQA